MLKVRILLGLLMIATLAVQIWIWEIWQLTLYKDIFAKIALIALVAVFQTTAVTMFLATFFTLDEKGRIPRDSLMYRISRYFYATKEKAEDGKIMQKDNVPEFVRFCPAFWILFVFQFIVLMFVVALIVLSVTIYIVITDPASLYPGPMSMPSWSEIGITTALFVALLAAFVVLTILHLAIFPWLKKSLLGKWIAAVYDKACPTILVEPAESS